MVSYPIYLEGQTRCKTPLNKNKQGKPQIDQGFISLSHSKECAAVVFDQNHEVGVDVEEIGEKVKRVAKKFLTDEEFIILESHGGDENFCLPKHGRRRKWYLNGLVMGSFPSVRPYKFKTLPKTPWM